jgi:hypothetical protein
MVYLILGSIVIFIGCAYLGTKSAQPRIEPPTALKAHWLDMNEERKWDIK